MTENDRIALRKYSDSRLIGLRDDRMSWWTHWRELGDYFIPRRYKWLITPNQGNRGSPINQRIIDSTGTLALRTLASGMMAGITSPAHPWFRLTIDDMDMREFGPVKIWLEDVENLLYRIFAESNFYNSMAVLYQDMACFGTAPMLIYDDYEDVIRCYNPCAGEYFVAVNDLLKVDTFYREFTFTVKQVVDWFGLANCSNTVQTLYRTGGAGLSKEIIVCHGIQPNPKGMQMGLPNAPFHEIFWEAGSSAMTLLGVNPFFEFPGICPRWEVTGNDAYGRSPAMDALGDVKQLQVEQKRKAQAIDKMVNPPLLADVSLKNEPLTSVSGGVTFVANSANTGGMRPVYEVKPDLEHMVRDLAEVQGRIRNVFYYDLFMMISQLDTVRSATEISARKEEKLIMLGPVLDRFEDEGLDPAINRVFNIAKRSGFFDRGALLQAPPELKGVHIKAEYVSMLAEAQRGVGLTAIERLTGWMGNIAAVKPEVLDNIDIDMAAEQYADMLRVSPRLIVPIKQVMKMRLARQREAADAKAMQEGLATVQGAKVLSETDVGGGQNALSAMFQGTTNFGPRG